MFPFLCFSAISKVVWVLSEPCHTQTHTDRYTYTRTPPPPPPPPTHTHTRIRLRRPAPMLERTSQFNQCSRNGHFSDVTCNFVRLRNHHYRSDPCQGQLGRDGASVMARQLGGGGGGGLRPPSVSPVRTANHNLQW